MGGFEVVLPLKKVPEHRLFAVTHQDHRLLLYREGERVHACLDRCPHANVPLSEGELENTQVTCRMHGWVFDLITGSSVPGPSAFALRQFKTRIESGNILVQLKR